MTADPVLFEEKQPPPLWEVLAAIAVAILAVLSGDIVGLLLWIPLFVVPILRRRTIRLTATTLRATAQMGIERAVVLDDILRCEVIDYQYSFWRGVRGPGMDFPSEVFRLRGTRGVRLDLRDGLHLLIGSQNPERLAAQIQEQKAALVPAC